MKDIPDLLGGLERHILMHDHWHMYRMEELWLTRDAYLQHKGIDNP